MPEEKPVSCARPTGGVVGAKKAPEQQAPAQQVQAAPEEKKMVMVGKKAPDFEAPCYYEGKFQSVKLSEYLGKWVVLCFYPGDFTFV